MEYITKITLFDVSRLWFSLQPKIDLNHAILSIDRLPRYSLNGITKQVVSCLKKCSRSRLSSVGSGRRHLTLARLADYSDQTGFNTDCCWQEGYVLLGYDPCDLPHYAAPIWTFSLCSRTKSRIIRANQISLGSAQA